MNRNLIPSLRYADYDVFKIKFLESTVTIAQPHPFLPRQRHLNQSEILSCVAICGSVTNTIWWICPKHNLVDLKQTLPLLPNG